MADTPLLSVQNLKKHFPVTKGLLQRYSRQLISIFDEEDITEYLLRFAGYGATAVMSLEQ